MVTRYDVHVQYFRPAFGEKGLLFKSLLGYEGLSGKDFMAQIGPRA